MSVSLYALTAVQMPETRMLGSSWMQHVLLCRSLVSLCFSSSTFWLDRGFVLLLFSVYSVTLSRELRDVNV